MMEANDGKAAIPYLKRLTKENSVKRNEKHLYIYIGLVADKQLLMVTFKKLRNIKNHDRSMLINL